MIEDKAANNTISGCTSYNNDDTQNSGNNADGVGDKQNTGSGNTWNNDTVYDNADDGFDFERSKSSSGITVNNCLAYSNGQGKNGNGNGGGNNGFRNNGGGNNVPGPTNYAAFSGFIAVRNIFNPARFAINNMPSRGPITPPRAGPAFSLVGTMSYEKGMFAFFDGNNYDLRKVLYASDTNSIAGYTVAEITPAGVQLQSADKKQTLRLKIGDVMRQNGDAWQLSGQGDLSVGVVGGFGTGGGSAAPGVTGNTSVPEAGSAPSPAPSPALEGNDTLRKLMQQRQQELK